MLFVLVIKNKAIMGVNPPNNPSQILKLKPMTEYLTEMGNNLVKIVGNKANCKLRANTSIKFIIIENNNNLFTIVK